MHGSRSEVPDQPLGRNARPNVDEQADATSVVRWFIGHQMQTYPHMTSKLKVGDEAPDFELLDQEGRLVSSRDYRGRKVLALYFYPKDFTKVCTMEAVAFRQMHEQFQAAGAEIIGVSSDDVKTHKEFAVEHELTFTLLSDEKQELRKAFGAYGLGGTPARTTYVIDRDWKIRMVYSSPLRSKEHAEEAMKAIQAL